MQGSEKVTGNGKGTMDGNEGREGVGEGNEGGRGKEEGKLRRERNCDTNLTGT